MYPSAASAAFRFWSFRFTVRALGPVCRAAKKSARIRGHFVRREPSGSIRQLERTSHAPAEAGDAGAFSRVAFLLVAFFLLAFFLEAFFLPAFFLVFFLPAFFLVSF